MNLNNASSRRQSIFRDKKLKRLKKVRGVVGYPTGTSRKDPFEPDDKEYGEHLAIKKGSYSVLAGRESMPPGFKMNVPDWITCQEKTFWKIVKLCAMQMAGISQEEACSNLGITRNRAWELRKLYPEEFAFAQKQIIQHAAVQLGVNLFTFKAALMDIVPDCLYWMKEMINDEKTGSRVRVELIKTIIKASGVGAARESAVEKAVNQELADFLRGAATVEGQRIEHGGL